jgi:hypothetical protein
MTKKFLIAAMGAAIVAGAHAQAPVLNHVKSLDEPFVGVAPNVAVLSGAGFQSADAAVVGDTMFYTTWSGGGAGTVRLIRVNNWNKPTATWEIYGEAPSSGGARNNMIITEPGNTSRIWWATNMGQGGPALNEGAVRRVKVNGTPLTDWLDTSASGPLSDGIIGVGEPIAGNNFTVMAVSFDPGFGPNPVPALTLFTFNSWNIRRINPETGAWLTTEGITVPKADPRSNRGFRDATYDSNGNLWTKNNNEVYSYQRTEQGQNSQITTDPPGADFTAGFAQQLLTTSNGFGFNGNPGTTNLSNLAYVPATATSDAFLVGNNRDGNVPNARIATIPLTGGDAYQTFTSGFDQFGTVRNFSGNVQGVSTANVNGQQYVFVSAFKGAVQGVDVYQVGDAGKISGDVTLDGWVGDGVNFLSQPFTVEVRDLSDNLLDRRTFAGGATTTNFSFITTARGPVSVTIDGATFLKRRLSATIGASETIFNTTLINGDVDADAEVGPGDFEAVVQGFGLPFGDPNYVAAADVDKDGEIGPSDFELVVANFGLGDE